MRLMISLYLLLATSAAVAGPSQLDSAKTLRMNRHLNPANLDASFAMLTRLLAADSTNVDAQIEMARVYYNLGDRAAKKEEKIRCFESGKRCAAAALALDSSHAPGYLWTAITAGRIGQTKGVLNSLGMVPEIRRNVNKALRFDPADTKALDVKAMLFMELPGFAGGSLDSSEIYLCRAVSADSNYTRAWLDLADLHIRRKQYEPARACLQKIIRCARPADPADWALHDRPAAARMLIEIAAR
jgi:tetratricopeptide (TPR) repeat protein